jgi:DNA repair exonuclease SbcCD nuclease subunit
MSRQGFRFVHATCLCLDEHLTGTGPLPSEFRQLAEDATFLAWEGVVDTCIHAQAEFLLLTGNSFHPRNNSLRARVALEKGFEKLAAHQIDVFIAPGNLDPLPGWQKGVHLPGNVTLLGTEDHEPVAVMRDQRVLASIMTIATPDSDETRWNGSGPAALTRHQAPFRIGMVAAGTPLRWVQGRPQAPEQTGSSAAAATLVQAAIDSGTDYIALGEGIPCSYEFASSLAHDPGCAQSLSRHVTGSRGCSLVNVDAAGLITIDSVAVAPIRWEERSLTLENHHKLKDLAERMALVMMEATPDNDERLWIVTWRVTGTGSLIDSLADSERQQELWKKVEEELTGERAVRRLYRLERTHLAAEATSPRPGESGESGLLREFQVVLQESGDQLLDQVRRDLLELDWMKHHDMRALRDVIQQISRPGVFRRAQAAAARWLE